MAVTELIATARPLFKAAIDKAILGDEEVTWDLTWTIMPPPPEHPHFGAQTVYMCYVHCAALHILGSFLQRSFSVPIGAAPEVIEHLVGQQVRALFDERSKLLAQSNGQKKLIIGG